MTKLKVYIVYRCEETAGDIVPVNYKPLSPRIIGVYLKREDAMVKVKRLQEDGKHGDAYYAVLKKTLQGDYWLSAKSGLMFINGRRVKQVIRNHLGE